MNPILGIDIAHRTFVAALWFTSDRIVKVQFDNHGGGFQKLGRWLKRHNLSALRAGLESTNTYAEGLALWLHEQGHVVYLLNPERTARYAQCLGQRNKTDPADASLIAAFVARHDDLTPWQPPSPAQRELRSLTRTRQQLVATKRQIGNQLRTVEPIARPHLQAVFDNLTQQIKALEKAVAQQLRTHPDLQTQVRRLMTFTGVGQLTAAVILAELPPVTAASDPRALSAWAGLTPRRCQSGSLELPAHLSRKGNSYLRDALYMPALVAKRHNPLLLAFAARLKAHGKSSGAILGAVAHKMLRILVALLRSRTDFDLNWSPHKT